MAKKDFYVIDITIEKRITLQIYDRDIELQDIVDKLSIDDNQTFPKNFVIAKEELVGYEIAEPEEAK